MKLKPLFVFTGVLGIFYGLVTLLIPGDFYAFYGSELTEAGRSAAQYQGAAYIGYAVLLFMALKVSEAKARKAIVYGLAFHFVIAFIVALKGMLAGNTNVWGWTTVAVCGLLSLGYMYFMLRGGD